MSVIDFDADCLDLSFSGSYPVKVSSLRDFEVLSRDMIRILTHAEIFSFAALKCLQSGNMDSRVFYGTLKSMSMTFMDSMSMVTVQTLGLQQMRHEAAIEIGTEFHNSLSKRPLLIRLGLTRLPLLLPESLGLNLARIRLSLRRLLLIGIISLTLVVY